MPSLPAPPLIMADSRDLAAAEAAGTRAAFSATQAKRSQPRQILVVEDLPRIQEFIREVVDTPGELSVSGFVTTAIEAIEQCMLSKPDALIVDLHLAAGSGLDVIKAVRREMQQGQQPLIMVLTNHATPQLEQACRRAGADHFLDKSKDFARVRTILLSALNNPDGSES